MWEAVTWRMYRKSLELAEFLYVVKQSMSTKSESLCEKGTASSLQQIWRSSPVLTTVQIIHSWTSLSFAENLCHWFPFFLFVYINIYYLLYSGTGKNLKVGVHVRRKAPKKIFVPLNFFVSTSSISSFGECSSDGQYSSVSLLFAVLLMVPSCANQFVKVGTVGGTSHRDLWSRRHC